MPNQPAFDVPDVSWMIAAFPQVALQEHRFIRSRMPCNTHCWPGYPLK